MACPTRLPWSRREPQSAGAGPVRGGPRARYGPQRGHGQSQPRCVRVCRSARPPVLSEKRWPKPSEYSPLISALLKGPSPLVDDHKTAVCAALSRGVSFPAALACREPPPVAGGIHQIHAPIDFTSWPGDLGGSTIRALESSQTSSRAPRARRSCTTGAIPPMSASFRRNFDPSTPSGICQVLLERALCRSIFTVGKQVSTPALCHDVHVSRIFSTRMSLSYSTSSHRWLPGSGACAKAMPFERWDGHSTMDSQQPPWI